MSEIMKEVIQSIESKLDILVDLVNPKLLVILIPMRYYSTVKEYIRGCGYNTNFEYNSRKIVLTYKGVRVIFADVNETMIAL